MVAGKICAWSFCVFSKKGQNGPNFIMFWFFFETLLISLSICTELLNFLSYSAAGTLEKENIFAYLRK
jgi:hypothetical protein